MHIDRRIVIGAASVIAAAAILHFGGCAPSYAGDNIILVSIDTLRADHLGAYGYDKGTSPEIDRFARESVLFEDCQAQSVSTLASHASMMTSQLVSHHGAYFARGLRLPSRVPTIAALLKERGYRTASFNDGGQIAPEYGLDRGFDVYEHMDKDFKIDKLVFERIVRYADAWFDNNGAAKFFLFLHTYESHAPYTPKPDILAAFDAGYSGPLPGETLEDLIDRINRGEVPLSEADKAHIVATYDAEILSMDASFGALIRSLKARGLLDKTILVFTSDHGEEFGEHELMATHSNTLFREQVHVPLIVRLPGGRLGGRRIGDLVRSIDIVPTIFALLGIAESPSFEGSSLVPSMRGRRPSAPVFSISQRDMLETYRSEFWSITNGRWKLYNGRLYDLAADPGETRDASASRPDIRALFRRRALRILPPSNSTLASEPAQVDEELKKKLKALGYVK
jgi:arylsulfatase A-like enzyme